LRGEHDVQRLNIVHLFLLTRIYHESLAATTDMAVLPGVLVPRDELPGGTPIFFALAALRSVPQAGSQFRGLATAIHDISGLKPPHPNRKVFSVEPTSKYSVIIMTTPY
jgi:hypothetical protein